MSLQSFFLLEELPEGEAAAENFECLLRVLQGAEDEDEVCLGVNMHVENRVHHLLLLLLLLQSRLVSPEAHL